jgi:hypothetical protein
MATAPTYDLNTLAGQMYLSGTLNMGGAGQLGTGVNAFLGNDYAPTGSRGNGSEGWDPTNITYNIDPLLALGDKMGYKGDTSQLRGISGGGPVFNPDGTITPAKQGYGNNTYDAYQQYNAGLNDYLKDYVNVSGMSPWAGTDDPRQAASTLYRNEGNVLTPQDDPRLYHAREKGSWAQENPDAIAVASIIAGGFLGGSALAAGSAGGAGAGAAGAASGAGGAGAGAGTAGAAAGATGAAGAGTGGIYGSIANSLGLGGWWGGLPGYAQGAITGALQGGVSSGIQGQNILKGAAMGGLSGGLGAWGGGALSSATGLPGWASKALVSAGMGGLSSGSWQGALGSGINSLANTGLGEMGVPSGLGNLISKYGTNAVMQSIGGGGTSPGGGGTGTGSSGGGGLAGGSRSAASTGGGGLSAGLLGNPQLGAARAQELSFLQNSYAPIAKQAAAKRIAEELDA